MRPGFPLIVNPQAFTAIIHSTAVTNMPFAFILYAVGLLIFNALINFVAGIPIVFYEMAAISGNPGLIVGALLVGAMLQAMAWLYLLEVLAQFFFPVFKFPPHPNANLFFSSLSYFFLC